MVLSLTFSQNLFSIFTRPEGQKFAYTIGYVPNAFGVVGDLLMLRCTPSDS